MKKQIKDALKKLGCTFRDCPECADIINVEVVDGELLFTDSYGVVNNLGLMDTDISGTFIGSATTLAALQTTDSDGNTLKAGDWSILTADDGSNVQGIYRYNGITWVLAKEYHNQTVGSLGFALNAAEQIMSDTEIQVQFGTSLSTPEITIDNAASTMTVQKDGVYKVTYKINMEDRTGERQNALCTVKVNGVVVQESKAYTYVRNTADGLATAHFHGAKLLTAGDVVTFYASNVGNNNTNDIAILANESFFQVEYTPGLTVGGA